MHRKLLIGTLETVLLDLQVKSVGLEEENGEFIPNGTLVPVVRNALLA